MRSSRLDVEGVESLALANQIGHIETGLNSVWQEMFGLAPDCVDVRRGQPLAWKELQRLLPE